MLNNETDLSFCIKEEIRQTNLGDLKIGADKSFSFMKENDNKAKPLVAIEFPYIIDESYPSLLKNLRQAQAPEEVFKRADKTQADMISVKFNLTEEDLDRYFSEIKDFLNKIPFLTTKPIILRGANNSKTDRKLVSFLAENAPQECIIAFAEEDTYEQIVPSVIKKNHILVLRTPIDINIAKELNILSTDKGLSHERILIDPDMGGLGYGLDYGYSIIEKIRAAAFEGDTMLNMPIIAFIGEESYRAKEAKSDTFSSQWGEYEQRAAMWEISAASAMISAGADIVVLWNPLSVETLKGLLKD